MRYRSVNDLDKAIRNKLHLIPKVDAVVGIPRSGMIAASLIALYLGKPLLTIDQITENYYYNFTNRIKMTDMINTVLVVDDSCNTGNCMKRVKNTLSLVEQIAFIYSAVYVTVDAIKQVDFYFEICDQLRVFEWNIMDHQVLHYACVDMDGVLCANPTTEQNDDGENYMEFLKTARPKFIPQHPIRAIVTCRLEKYREQTEAWLKEHGIKYDKLYMMDYPTAADRRRANNYTEYKASIYERTRSLLFIESEPFQAKEIYELVHHPVYCVGDNVFYGGC